MSPVHAAPPVVNSEVFARLPERLRARENVRLQSGVARDIVTESETGTILSARLETAGKTMYSHM